MKTHILKIFIVFFIQILCIFGLGAQTNPNHVYVNGYTRANGTCVAGYYRTAPNSTNRDNFSTIGNVNPYTGQPGYIVPDNKPLPSDSYSTVTYSTSTGTSSGSTNSTTTSTVYSTSVVRYTTADVNLRSGPGTNYDIKDLVYKDAGVRVISTSGDWSYVLIDNIIYGYIYSAYLK